MSRARTLEAISSIEPASLWGIGMYGAMSGPVDLPIAWSDIERDTAWAAQALDAWEVAGAGPVVIVSGAWEAPWFGPIRRALRSSGTAYAPCEIWGWDLTRVDLFVRRLEATTIIGLTSEQADAMAGRGDVAERLRNGPRLIVRADALARLRQMDIEAAPMAILGPATGWPCADGAAVHVNSDEWRFASHAGQLVVTTVQHREHQMADVRLAIEGDMMTDACSCGVPGQRIRLR